MRLLHIDATLGAAGDMILAALLDAGADRDDVLHCIGAVAPEADLDVTTVQRRGMRALHVSVAAAQEPPHRAWSDVRERLSTAALPDEVRSMSLAAFEALATAEGRVHGVAADDVHFHEVGATDSIADIVGCCAALHSLGEFTVVSGPVATGSGYVRTAHGTMPVPPPAVAEILAGTGAQVMPGPAQFEACTPTAAALLATWVDKWVAGPALRIHRVGVGAGSADPAGHANVVRVLLGTAQDSHVADRPPGATLLETNVDDLDPRLWPKAIAELLAAGASDAWLTPIHMKKGRPAVTLSVLCRSDRTEDLAERIMQHTTAIGMRVIPIGKIAADRQSHEVRVRGHRISVKVARFRGRVVNVQPEWEHVRAAAEAESVPAKRLLSEAITAAAALWP